MIKRIFWNSDERRIRALWRQIIQLVLYNVILIQVVYVVSSLLGVHLSTLHYNLALW